MGWTKRNFVEHGFAEIGLAGYVFDLSASQLQRAVQTLDAMMATWNALGIRVGYPISSTPEASDISAQTGVPDSANEAIYCNLAIRLAPRHGKTVSAELRTIAHQSYMALLNRAVRPIPVQMPATMPAGAGNRGYRQDRVFVDSPVEPIAAGSDSTIDGLDV